MKAPPRPARSLLTPSFIEQLEARQLLSVGLSGGILTVNGSNRADNIVIKASGTQIVVHLNGTTKTFVRSQVKQLLVNGNSGNDKITVAGNFADATLNGGNGNDKINGSGGGDLIQGGAGSDIINGRGGDDQIYGDAGNDVLAGGAGNDTIGGDDEDTLVAQGATAPADIAGNDKLNGGAGDDWLLSGTESDINNDLSGADQLTGGSGTDITDIRGRDNTVNHFEIGTGDGDTITDEGTDNDIIPTKDVTGPLNPTDPESSYTHHKHAFMKIFLEDAAGNRTLINIPSRVGEFNGEPVVHTHDNPSPLDVRGFLLHFHNTASSGGTNRVFTLGDFFQHWGISLSSKNIGRFRVDAKHTLTMQVKPHGQGGFVTPAAGDNFNKYVIQTNDSDAADSTKYDQIQIIYKTLS